MARYKETTGYIIHQRAFKDTSLILEFFSKELGLIHIIAKGIQKNKLLKQQLHYFSLVKVQYFGQSQLKTLSNIETIELLNFKELLHQTTGLYLNELLRYSLIECDQDFELFSCYQKTLKKIGHFRLTTLLRRFEKEILKYNGFELDVSSFFNDSDWLSLSETHGLYVNNKENQGLCQVADLRCFLSHKKMDKISEKRINKFMLIAIDLSLSHKKIYSRELLKSITIK